MNTHYGIQKLFLTKSQRKKASNKQMKTLMFILWGKHLT